MSEQAQLGPSQDGTVILDIGGDVGSMIILATPAMAGEEIEISPVDGHGFSNGAGRSHVAVRERHGPAGTRYAAIYPALTAGDYTIWYPHDHPVDVVTVTGGRIAEVDWTSEGSVSNHPQG